MQAKRQRNRTGNMSMRWIRLCALCLMLTAGCCLAAGCGLSALGDASAGDGAGLSTPAPVLPAGWRVYLPDREFSSITVAKAHVLAGGMEGIVRYDPERDDWQPVQPQEGSFRLVKAMHADDRGNLWIGCQTGLACLPDFVGTSAGGLPESDTLAPVACVRVETLAGRKIEAVSCLLEARDGTLYVGSQAGALALPEEGAMQLAGGVLPQTGRWLAREDGMPLPMVNAMLQDRRGTLWFGSYIARNGGVACVGEGFTQFFDHDSGLADDYVTTIAEDADGSVWVGTGVYTSGGAARFVWRENAYFPDALLGTSDGLAGAKVRFIHVDAGGVRWICSEYDGIAVLSPDGRRLRLLTTADGMPDNEAKQIAADAEGGLWIACRRGVLHLDAAAVKRITDGAADE